MNAALRITAAVAFAALTGCVGGCSNAAPAAHLNPACSAAFAALPAHPPVTEREALADEQAIDRVRSKDNMLLAMTHVVGFTVSILGHDIAPGRNASAGRVTYNADVTVLRSYCQAISK